MAPKKAKKQKDNKEKPDKGNQGKKNSKKQKKDGRQEEHQEQHQDDEQQQQKQEEELQSPQPLDQPQDQAQEQDSTPAEGEPAEVIHTSPLASPKVDPLESPAIETLPHLPEPIATTPLATTVNFAGEDSPSPETAPNQAQPENHFSENEDREEPANTTLNEVEPEAAIEPENQPEQPVEDDSEQKAPEHKIEVEEEFPPTPRVTTPTPNQVEAETESLSLIPRALSPTLNNTEAEPESLSPSPKVATPTLNEVEADIEPQPPAPRTPTPIVDKAPSLPEEADQDPVNVFDSFHKSRESVPTPTEIAPKTQRLPPAAEPRSASPALPSAKPKTSSPPVYGYPQSRSPAPVHSPHYAYSVPYTHPYAPTPVYPNGSFHDVHSGGAMAVSVAPHCSPAVRPSAMDGYHSRIASRGSFSRGHADYPYNGSYHQPKQRGSTPTQQRPAENGNSESLHVEGDTIKLLQRIQNVIPDINRLVTSYRDTQNQLSAHVAQSRQIEEQHERSLMEKEFYIDALQAQIQKTAKENAAEVAKLRNRISELRMELGGLQEQHRDVEDSLEELKKANDELTLARADLEQEISNLQRTIQEQAATHAQELQRQEQLREVALATQKEELEGYFQEIKNEDDRLAAEQLQAREQELYDERDKLNANWEQRLQDLEQSKTEMAADYDGKLQSKQGELDTKQGELESKQAELDAKQAELEAKQGELDAKQEELNTAKSDLEAKQAELKAKQGELEAKQAEVDAKQEEISGLKSELESKIAELEGKQHELEGKQAELDSKQTELQSIQAALEDVKTELEEKKAELESKQAELEAKQNELTAKQAELDDVKEQHAAELATLRAALEEQTNAAKASEEKIAAMTTEQQQKEEEWQKDREDFEAQLRQKAGELEEVLKEKEALALDGKTREEQLQNIVEEMRQTHDNLNKDRERLKKTLHSLGEATDMKIKGDAFFIDCFGDLSRLIVELSKEYFTYIPIEPPGDILAKIPSDLPQFLDNTPASRELRAAYVQHVVSKTLTYRIFQPFLFTLGRRYDKADTFFQMLSIDIRRKSVRREAFWRQQTLRAAYTTSDAKQSINVVAAVIVDEIVDHIRHFTDPKHLDSLLTSVRKIVKLAAETWRLARVERELIVASMPSAQDDQTANELWDEFVYDPASPSPTRESTGARTPLLRMLPHIQREPAHEDFLQPEEAEKANLCVYLPGVILYTDSPCVMARKEELAKKTVEAPTPADGPVETNGAHSQPNGTATCEDAPEEKAEA
ncbi:predicted protein [Uncinocarpus reesii 1704]|uniref:RNA polymerase Rpb1 C-terminal repeat domain-containing protein n=1 Tax=Uncinocarpus reesii (strain UAMH 1704) TaxID=336963 RepID=C4JIG4_UNCRE|nr:uncharacterized protein UREG_01501 [Uncinocarpus reesii 1704]EEP76652.1 predicted protein [Uncinocarpus reesii 1704]